MLFIMLMIQVFTKLEAAKKKINVQKLELNTVLHAFKLFRSGQFETLNIPMVHKNKCSIIFYDKLLHYLEILEGILTFEIYSDFLHWYFLTSILFLENPVTNKYTFLCTGTFSLYSLKLCTAVI